MRDNILFGAEYDEKRFADVVDACCLASDLELLANGDQGCACSFSKESRLLKSFSALKFIVPQ